MQKNEQITLFQPLEKKQEQHHNHAPPPEGWSFHLDPETGHGYYLHEASATSVWAGVDGSFPGVNGDPDPAAAEGASYTVRATGEEGEQSGGIVGCGGDEDVGDAYTDWDAEILMAGGTGGRPAPTAPPPPPFPSALELAELQQAEPGVGPGAENGEHPFSPRCAFGERNYSSSAADTRRRQCS